VEKEGYREEENLLSGASLGSFARISFGFIVETTWYSSMLW